MEIVSLFNGAEMRSHEVISAEEIRESSAELPIGDGWGQLVRGTVEALRELGATENRYGGWTLAIGSGALDCVTTP